MMTLYVYNFRKHHHSSAHINSTDICFFKCQVPQEGSLVISESTSVPWIFTHSARDVCHNTSQNVVYRTIRVGDHQVPRGHVIP